MCSGFRRMFMYSNLLALKEMETSTPWADAYRIAFIGKNVCHKKENSCITDTDGFAVAEERVALVSSTQNSTFKETLTLIHEFGHLFGAPDHYSYSLHQDAERNYPDLTFEPDCIYGYNKYLLTDTSICSGCDFVITERCNALLGEN